MRKPMFIWLGVILSSYFISVLGAPRGELSLRETLQLLDHLQREEEQGQGLVGGQQYDEEIVDDEIKDDEEPSSPPAALIPPHMNRIIHSNRPLNKRASYMSLCHFKICNMGRKRSSWNNPLLRH